MTGYKTLRLPGAIVALGLSLVHLVQPAAAAVYTWGNVGTDFGTASNWSTNIAPGAADIGLFNGSSYAFDPATALSPVAVGGLWDTVGAAYPQRRQHACDQRHDD